ncbi:MAG: hypothetical protein NTW49_07985 [Bacteroidia bacterium]|nr:hypothetical protein [Bacteroidia bacterium]
MKSYKKALGLLIACLLISSCADHWLNETDTSILTGREWQLNSCTNVNANTDVIVSNYLYNFYADGTYRLLSGNDAYTGTWQLLQDNDYLKIGNDIYRIIDLTGDVMILRYGEYEFSFLPV